MNVCNLVCLNDRKYRMKNKRKFENPIKMNMQIDTKYSHENNDFPRLASEKLHIYLKFI